MQYTHEIWVDIKNYEGKYQISSQGRVRSLKRHKINDKIENVWYILKPWRGTTSLYLKVYLTKPGDVRQRCMIHRLVAEHFLPDWNPTLEINHIDGNRDNNSVENLEMCTHRYNILHARSHHLIDDYGEKSPNAKLSNKQAQEIRTRYAQGGITQKELALEFGVSRSAVSSIVRYKGYCK